MGIQAERQLLLPKSASPARSGRDSLKECATSIDTAAKTTGALRGGPPPDLRSVETLTLLAQFAGVGFASGALPGAIYPVFQGYLNAEGTTIASASMLVHLPWSFKVVFGLLSDCAPIMGYRRAPYMALGWCFSCAMLLSMESMSMGDPYYIDPALRSTDPDTWTPEQWQEINASAPAEAGALVVPMLLAAFGFLVAEVAADSTVVELAQREPIETRGTLQSAAHSVRMACSALGALSVAFAFNSADYGGSFSFSLSFPQLMGAMAWTCAPLALAALLLLQHESRVRAPNLKTYASRFWVVLQQRAVLQIAAYKFFSGALNSFHIVASSNIKAHWVHATPFNSSVMHVVGTVVYAATLAVTARHGLQWNWRVSIALTVVVGVVLDGFMTMLVTWDVVRDQWFWLGVPVVGHVPEGVRFIVANYVVVELIEPGLRGRLVRPADDDRQPRGAGRQDLGQARERALPCVGGGHPARLVRGAARRDRHDLDLLLAQARVAGAPAAAPEAEARDAGAAPARRVQQVRRRRHARTAGCHAGVGDGRQPAQSRRVHQVLGHHWRVPSPRALAEASTYSTQSL